MGTHAESVSQAENACGHFVELLLPGYPGQDADRLLSLLDASGQPTRLHQLTEDIPAAESVGSPILHVAVIHLDHLTTAPLKIIKRIQELHPQAGIIFASGTPAKHADLANALEIQDLYDCRDSLHIALAIRRSYRRLISQRERRQGEAPPVTARTKSIPSIARDQAETPGLEPVHTPLPESNGTPKLHPLFRPLVSLDGDSRAHYLVNPSLLGDNGNSIEAASSTECKVLFGEPLEIDGWLVEQAADKLAELRGKAGLHLAISEESLESETLLLRTCESLRRFNVRGSSLYFNFDATLVKEENRHFLRFLSGLKKVNCHISCYNVDDTRDLPAILARYDVHMAQYAETTIERALNQSDWAERLAKTNIEIQRRGIKTLAGNIESAEMLTRLWQLGVNYVWGDFLYTPQIHQSR